MKEITNTQLYQSKNLRSKEILNALKITYNSLKKINPGENAQYIPALKNANSNIFGISIVTTEGKIYEMGDATQRIAIESIGKVFTLCLALEESNKEEIMNKIGVSQSFLPFNSILASEIMKSYTINPFVNAGAMATTSLIKGDNKFTIWTKIYNLITKFAGRKLQVNDDIYNSELNTNTTNKALAYLLKSHKRFYNDIDTVLDVYTRQGSIMVSSTELATMGSTLANCGRNPYTSEQVISSENAAFVLATMMSDGLYNYSGKWTATVGIPGKSGVGGGILAIVPGKFAIGVTSPKLDENGNSYRGIKACEMISNLLGLSLFKPDKMCSDNLNNYNKSKISNILKRINDETVQTETIRKYYHVDPNLINKNKKKVKNPVIIKIKRKKKTLNIKPKTNIKTTKKKKNKNKLFRNN